MPSRPTRCPTLTIMSTAAAGDASTDAPCITLPSPSSVALLQTTYISVLGKTADNEATLCTKCHQDMRLDVGRKRWRCGGTKCRTERSLIKGTFFSKCKLPLRKAITLNRKDELQQQRFKINWW
ncbi:hypothetical protein PHYSODRAFT_257296 [Phytophthora sojae]|uniref:Uncharacterized protein n=1 Tax=Phytophthora sojae (strain P6497) TaxID=1094619 RepID=G4YET6_PHYSP|nr:hypothetical protein PHYSODRAFT_257296 [Phytophthora sojae]EGZ26930.1 hypothetical protein PHYSODRAFT_257296 [Phytophthora sojae]|eukprot:XP_009514205.1 hypothetical protein PHYSODRAFT_257296 [Phytophthora sojae]